MSAQLSEFGAPVSGPLTRVFDCHGRLVGGYTAPEVTIQPEDFYGSITKGYATNTREKLRPLLSLGAIAIEFAKITEGRPYTLALRLRELGYRGELHAVGAVNRELMHHLIRVGFSHIHLEEHGDQIAHDVVFPFSFAYQSLGA